MLQNNRIMTYMKNQPLWLWQSDCRLTVATICSPAASALLAPGYLVNHKFNGLQVYYLPWNFLRHLSKFCFWGNARYTYENYSWYSQVCKHNEWYTRSACSARSRSRNQPQKCRHLSHRVPTAIHTRKLCINLTWGSELSQQPEKLKVSCR